MEWVAANWFWILLGLFLVALAWYIERTRPIPFRVMWPRQAGAFRDARGRIPLVLVDADPVAANPPEIIATGEAHGAGYEVTRVRMPDGVPDALIVTHLAATPGEFIFMKVDCRNRAHSFMKRHGIQYNRICDSELDHSFDFWVGERSSEIVAVLQNDACKSALKTLLNAGCNSVRNDARAFDAACSVETPQATLDSSVLAAILAALATLERECRVLPPSPARWRDQYAAQLYAGVPVVLSMAASLCAVATVRWRPPLNVVAGRSLLYALVPTVIFTILGWIWLRRFKQRNDVPRVYRLVGKGATAFAGLAAGIIVILLANGALDGSAPRTHVVSVASLRSNPDLGTCYARVPYWEDPSKEEPLTIWCADYDALRSLYNEYGAMPDIELETKSGFLGLEWIVAYEILFEEFELLDIQGESDGVTHSERTKDNG